MDMEKRSRNIKFGTSGVLDERTARHLKETLSTRWITNGPKEKLFQEKFGNLFSYKYNIAMTSGTAADMAACMVLYDYNAKPSLNRADNEIIIPALSFVAVPNAVLAAGFKPVFVDINRETLNIDTNKIEEAITPRTRAIIAVHTLGKTCEMDKIMEIAKANKLFVSEDGCEAHGAQYKGKPIGHYGDMITLSAFAAHLICTGEGGMVSTQNEEIADILISVKNHGRKKGDLYFDHIRLALNFKIDDLRSCIGIPQAEDFWKTFNTRKQNLNYLLKKIEDLKEFAYFNKEEPYEVLSPHAFSLTLKDSKYNYKELCAFLKERGVESKRNFGSNPTQHKAFEFLGHKLGDFPESEFVGDNGLHIGVHQELNNEDLDYISEVLHEYFSRFKTSF